jgi:hypothetical protein
MFFGIALIAGLFVYDNQEFFNTVEQNIEDGFTWEYVGKQDPAGQPAVTVLDGQNNEVIYFKMTK